MRVKGLNKDRGDWNQLRNHRMEHFGFSVSNEFYQHSPFFWNREGCELQLTGHYRGASAFLICNGPSLVNGKFNLSLLKRPGVITYGMNNGPRTIRPNLWSCVDDPKRFIKSIWLDPCITKIVPHTFAEKKIFDNEQWQDTEMVVGQCPNTVYFHRNEKFVAERFLVEDTVCWGNSGDNGGGRSVMLASLRILFLLGFRNVYLLGADFNMSETATYHFDEQRHKGAVNCNMNTYEKLKNEYFPALKPYFDAEGFNVYNCNPDSKLEVFDFVDFNDAIIEAISKLGDVDNERTWGMYSKPEERQKWVNEPDNSRKAHIAKIANRPATPVYEEVGQIEQPNPNVENVENEQEMQAEEAQEQVVYNNEDERVEIENILKPRPMNTARAIKYKINENPVAPNPSLTFRPKAVVPAIQPRPPKPAQQVPHIIRIPRPDIPIQEASEKTPKAPIYTGNKIVSKIPCGGGVSNGSSVIPRIVANPPNPPNPIKPTTPNGNAGYITIPDNGR